MNLKTIWNKVLKKSRGFTVHNSEIDRTSKVESGCNIVSVKMGRYSFCGYDCEIVNTDIGAFCSIANNVKIGGARHPLEWVSTSPVFYSGRDSVKKKFSTFDREPDKHTVIGNDVWIGANSIIIQGVKIGNGSIVGAGSVVTKDVGDYEIVAGNPAHLIRKRFEERIIKDLLDSEWWNLSDAMLQMCSSNVRDPELFLSVLNRYRNKTDAPLL